MEPALQVSPSSIFGGAAHDLLVVQVIFDQYATTTGRNSKEENWRLSRN